MAAIPPVSGRATRPWSVVAACVLLSVGLRLPFLTSPLSPDEAGYLLVARHWDDGPYLYGAYWVDRPVLLILFFRLAEALPGEVGLRLLGCVVAAVLVAAAGWAGYWVADRTGAVWGALVAAALGSTHLVGAEVMNDKLLAVALVMVGCALTLAAVRGHRRRDRILLAAAAGSSATSAVLVQQSYVEAVAFAAALLFGLLLSRALEWRPALEVAAGGLVGLCLPVLAAWLWGLGAGPSLSEIWYAAYGYRFETVDVIAGGHRSAPEARMVGVANMSVLSGVAPLAVALGIGVAEMRPGRPQPTGRRALLAAVVTMLAVSLAGMVLGGSWWRDYLLQPVPALALGAALVGSCATLAGMLMRLCVLLTVVAAVVGVAVGTTEPVAKAPAKADGVGQWLGAAAEEHDSAVVLWGNPNVLEVAGLTSPYPYLWSLPIRTHDPDLELLLGTLRGPEAPAWIVEWNPLNSWSLDRSGRFRELLRERYRLVAAPCGLPVYLRHGVERALPETVTCGPDAQPERVVRVGSTS